MKIVVPLKADEPINLKSRHEIIPIKARDCLYPFGHVFFAEIGKYLTFYKTQYFHDLLKTNEDIALVQNKRFFENLDELFINNVNDVILANKEWVGNIEIQFKQEHSKVFYMFDELMKTLALTDEDVSAHYIHPHNILIAKPSLVKDYLTFLESFLTPLFKEDYQWKYGALIAERALHLWCVKNQKNIIERTYHVNN